MKRKSVVSIALVFVAILVLIGSGVYSQAAEKQIVLKFWKGGNDVIWHDYYLKLFKEYESKHPNIKIEFAEAPFGDAIDTKLNTAFASGAGPDIIHHALNAIAIRADKKQFEPLDKYIAHWKDKKDIMENIYEMGRYKGKIYGMGLYPTPAVFAYRKDFFKEAGLDPEKPPATWEELAEDAVKLTKRNGNVITRAGLNMPIDEIKIIQPFAIQNGAQIFNKKGLPTFDNRQMVETLAYLTDLFKNKKVAIEQTKAKENQQSLFATGQAAMSIVQPTWIAQLLKNDPSLKDKIGFIDMKRKTKAIWSGCELLFINSESKHKQESWDLIQFIMGKEEMWQRYVDTKCPVVRKSLQDQYIKDDPFINKVLLNAIAIGQGAPKTSWSQLYVYKYLPQAQQEAFYGKKTPAEALKDNLKQLKDEIAAMQ